MKHTTLFTLVVLATAFAGNTEAVFKCTTNKGVVYQDRQCQEGNETEVQLTVPTGELAPKSTSAQPSTAQGNAPRVDSRSTPSKAGRGTATESLALTKPAGARTTKDGAASDEPQKRETRPAAEAATAPMTAEQARKAEATAKYYTTDPFLTGSGVPEQMNCESPSGEKRRFLLVDGKLSSI